MTPQSWYDLGIDVRGRTSGSIKTRCPKCTPMRKHKSDPSLSVDLDEGLYKCHNDGCDFAGKLNTGTRDWRDLPPTPAYVKPEPPAPDVQLRPKSRAFFRDRGIDPDLAEAMGVYSNREDTAIALPYTKQGEVVHIKYREITQKRFWSTKDSEPVFYNLDGCEGASDVVITEGEMDVLALMAAGVDTAMSVPNGAPGKDQKADGKLQCMPSAQHIFDNAKRVIVAVDADEPGRVLQDEMVRRIGPEKCFTVTWPAPCKDANETLMALGPEAVAQAIADAKPVPIRGLIYAKDVKDEIWRNRHGRKRRGVEVPQWPDFNDLFRIGQGHLSIWTGAPSSGKSAFLSALLVNVAQNDPSWKFAFFSPEQTPPAEFFEALVTIRLGAPLDTVTEEQYLEAVDWVHEHFILEHPESRTLVEIMELARVCVMRHGVKGIVIDPWTEVESPRGPGVNESEHIGMSLAKIRAFGQDHKTHMAVVAHPTKPDRLNQDKPVTPYDISGSANWFNKADAMVSVFRRDRTAYSSPVDVYVQKTRFKAFGRNGVASFGFDIDSGRYFQIAKTDQEQWT